MKFGLLREQKKFTHSVAIHAMLGDYPYEPIEIAPEALDAFLKRREFEGLNVTIPYKETVIPYLEALTPEARAIGAVNTIVNHGGKLYGYNTDAFGFECLLKHIGIDVRGKKAAILGTGGTSKTASYVLKQKGASSIYLVSRTGKNGACTYESIPQDIEILVNTTPCGMYPDNDACIIDLDRFPNLIGVVDVISNPLRSKLVIEARKRGIPSEGGFHMLVAQAVQASDHFTGIHPEADAKNRIYNALRQKIENIVLIGMPSSGKTTVGKKVASALKRPFVDIDAIIECRVGMSIPDYFAAHGEAAFRDVEEQVIAEVSKETGQVISTGGGSILREANIDRLKQNGKVFFLDRPLPMLCSTASRPLSSDADSLRKRFEERYSLYCKYADVIIDGSKSFQGMANAVKGAKL